MIFGQSIRHSARQRAHLVRYAKPVVLSWTMYSTASTNSVSLIGDGVGTRECLPALVELYGVGSLELEFPRQDPLMLGAM